MYSARGAKKKKKANVGEIISIQTITNNFVLKTSLTTS